MKQELKLTSESIHDEAKIEAALRATDMLYALKEIYRLNRKNKEIVDVISKLDLMHLVDQLD